MTSPTRPGWGLLKAVVALLALAAIVLAMTRLLSPLGGLEITTATVERTPVTIYRAEGQDAPGPAVLVAHGFAGSRQLMQSYAVALAHAGYVAVTYDALGHGQHPGPLPGNLTEETGATVYLLDQLDRVVAHARTLAPGHDRVALLGHSMASDIIVRQAGDAAADYAAVVAVSMFSPVVTAEVPPNLLVVVGELEPGVLKDEAERVVAMIADADPPQWGTTYGAFDTGAARRMAISPGVEHIGVLFGREGIAEAVAWIDQAFGRTDGGEPVPPWRGSWVLVLLAAVVVLVWPATALLPRVVAADGPAIGAGLPWRRLWPVAVAPAVLTPLILWPLPTDWLPVLVGDYLLLHFALYGALSALGLWWVHRRAPLAGAGPTRGVSWGAFALATLGLTAIVMIGLGGPIHLFVANFLPTAERAWLVPEMMLGTLAFFLVDEWMTRGAGRGRGASVATKALFLASLVPAIALDLNSLFFLIILFPVIVLFFVIFGLVSAWARRRTGHPWVGALVSAFVFAWCVAVTFPIVTGA
ncbi:alpha/beta fold hydrolase [Roseospira navarrensis]|uniref:alpha/beta fold hydrolase n=1 Tax=Roseospira navarrensis TaxID=140058 RepID=UPI001B86F848